MGIFFVLEIETGNSISWLTQCFIEISLFLSEDNARAIQIGWLVQQRIILDITNSVEDKG